LIQTLKKGGKIIEESPFARKRFEKRKMHLPDKVGLSKLMASEGMVLEKAYTENAHIWRKRG
jgi:hypothetical protein